MTTTSSLTQSQSEPPARAAVPAPPALPHPVRTGVDHADDRSLRFRLLGPFEVWRGRRRIALGGPRSERLLALLVAQPGRVVSLERLIDAVWDTDPPATAAHQIRKVVAGLRAALAPDDIVVTDGPGYRADLRAARLDIAQFDALVAGAGEVAPDQTVAMLHDGLALWRGPALTGMSGRLLADLALVLDDRRLTAIGAFAEACVVTGRADEAVAALSAAVREHPLRENLRYLLVLALCRCGRQAEALAEYESGRRLLAGELGVDPGPALSDLYRRMLSSDPDLCEPGAAPTETVEQAIAITAPTVAETADPVEDVVAVPPRPARMGSALPYDTPDFTGRRAEIAALSSVIPDASQRAIIIVTIDGMAGVGKTALAVHTAHRLADTFPDGQLFLDLRGSQQRPMSPLDALERLLHAVGVPGSAIPAGLDDRSALWRATISDRSIVLLLDDAASSTQVRPLLPGRAGSVVLVTSRTPLTGIDGAVPISLAPPSHDDSLALVRNVLGSRVAGEPDAVNELIEECGHLPLALRIAAARLQGRPLWSVAHLLDRLRDADEGIRVLSVDDRSVEATFRLTYDGLADDTRQAFRLLASMPVADFTVATAAAVTGRSAGQAAYLLDHLLDARLVEQRTADRYRFHDLVRSFAQGCARREDDCQRRGAALRSGYDTLLRQVRSCVAWVATGTAAERSAARAWLDAETDNLVSAVQAAPSLGLGPYAVELGLAVSPHLDARGLWTRQLRLLQLATSAAHELGDTDGELRARLACFTPLLRQGRVDQARDATQTALQLARRAGDRTAEATCLGNIGSLLRGFGQYRQSLEFHERAIRMHRDAGNQSQETSALLSLGLVYGELGRQAEAVQAARDALRLLTEHELSGGVAEPAGHSGHAAPLIDIGVARSGLGEFAGAEAALRSATALAHDSGSPYDVTVAEVNLAKVLLARGRMGEALDAVDRAAAAAARLDAPGMPSLVADLETTRGRIFFARGATGAAASAYGSALASARLAGDRGRQVVALDALVELRRATGDGAAADDLAREADMLADRSSVGVR